MEKFECKPGFTITERGFRVAFENGYTISVVFVHGNYCNNYYDKTTNFFGGFEHIRAYIHAYPEIPAKDYPKQIHCPNAEIAIWNPGGDWITESVCNMLDIHCGDSVVGYITPADFLRICNYVAAI